MADQLKNHTSRRRLADIQFLLTVLAVALAAVALFIAWQNNRHVKLVMGEEVTEENAQAILERANDAVNFADGVLSFLEGVAVLVGVGVTAGALLVRNTLQKQADSLTEFVQQTQQAFAERELHLNKIEADFRQGLQDMVDKTRRSFADVQEQARKSFRVVSLLVLAEQQVRAHNIDAALALLQNAHELDPDNQAANYLLGYLLTARREFDKAIEHLQHALALEPDFPPAIAALGLALRRKGDNLSAGAEHDRIWAEAENKLLDALTQDPRLTDAEGESYYGTLGGLYRRQNRYNAALDAYERAHRVTPNSSYPVINLAALHKHQGNEKQAAHYFEQVLKSAELQLDDDPRDLWTRADYAQALLALGQPQEALTQLTTVVEQGAPRGLLETIRSGLLFLREAPESIEGLEDLIVLLDRALEEQSTI